MIGFRLPGFRRFLIAAWAALALAASPLALAQSEADPLEPLNRAIFGFNDALDGAVIKPVAQAYAEHVPAPLRTAIGNFMNNLLEPWSALNNLLQGKPERAVSDVGRFLVNTVLTLGLGDVATEFGLERTGEDLGQTLGVWGFGAGPYLVLPVLGPSSLRDGVGRVTAIVYDPSRKISSGSEFAAFTAVRIVDLRAELLPMDKLIDSAALDRYSFIRNAYLQRRQSLIEDRSSSPTKE